MQITGRIIDNRNDEVVSTININKENTCYIPLTGKLRTTIEDTFSKYSNAIQSYRVWQTCVNDRISSLGYRVELDLEIDNSYPTEFVQYNGPKCKECGRFFIKYVQDHKEDCKWLKNRFSTIKLPKEKGWYIIQYDDPIDGKPLITVIYYGNYGIQTCGTEKLFRSEEWVKNKKNVKWKKIDA